MTDREPAAVGEAGLRRAVKAYDVRGRVGVDVDARTFRALGVAIADELVGADRVLLIGRDMRTSSAVLARALAAGARAGGCEVVDLGLASTDLVTWASGELQAASVVVTASHNPGHDNGCKLTGPGARPVSFTTGLEAIRDRAIAALAASGDEPLPAESAAIGDRRLDLTARFAAHVRSFAVLPQDRPLRVAVDGGNGMVGAIWPAVVAGLPIETTPLYLDLDGTFPNHPANPLDPANLVDLQTVVRDGGHDLGLAFDGDADRVFAVDEQGTAVSASLIGAIIAERLLDRHPGATVLHNAICSRVVAETVRAAGGVAERTPVGHSLIKARMASTGAIFAVEHSGHFYFRDNHRADSGIIAALLLLEAVARSGRPLSEVVAPYDRTVTSGELSVRVDDVEGALARVREVFDGRASIDGLDGVTIRCPDGTWANVRASNTEALLRCNVEADDLPRMQTLRDELLGTVTGARTDGPGGGGSRGAR
ncbi:MAG: phosphomannomutase/phosphoglucomutase [Nitriliruptoraceae bacterium]|nr:phosphomannomutase/phosphoglucomutase [Nitriliruptoraceae bacterium]